MGNRTTDNAAVGIVRPGEVLTAEAARRGMSMGDWAWRGFQASIPLFKIGRQTYCCSNDIIAECERRRDDAKKGNSA